MRKKPYATKYCAAFGCFNKEIKTPNIHMFKLPSDVERRNKWLKLIDREDLLKKKDLKSSSYCVCSAHFLESDIEIITMKKLHNDAMPSRNLNYHVTTVSTETQTVQDEQIQGIIREDVFNNPDMKHNNKKGCKQNFDDSMSELRTKIMQSGPVSVLDNAQPSTSKKKNTFRARTFNVMTQTNVTVFDKPVESSEIEEVQISASHLLGTQRKRKLNIKLENLEKKRCLEQELNKIKKEIHGTDTLTTPSNDNDEINKKFQKLIQWQNNMKNKQKGSDFDPEFKFFALSLYFSSPQTYQSLKSMLKLPSEKTLIKYKLNIRPELDKRVFNCLASKLQSLPDAAKYCTLCVDVITLKRHVYYDVTNDDIIGLHNINGKVKDEVASYAYVIMLRGIAVNWKQPMAFALLARNEHYDELDDWISEIILKLYTIGIRVMAIVSDQAPIFNKYAKENKKVTTKKPYFTLNGNKIYYIFDVPNMLTCLRNDLLENDFFFDGERISWEYIETMYHHQKEQRLGLIPNVTNAHIDPKTIQKTIPKYAAQIFSRSVYGALNTFIYADFLPQEAKATADFIKPINDTFDVLNSNTIKNSNKYQRAFTLSDEHLEVLEGAKSMFRNLTAFCPTTGTNNTDKIMTFENFQISIQAIIMISIDLRNEGLNYIFTRRLNQEPLKAFHATMRKKSRLPTVGIKYMRSFSKSFLGSMFRNSSSSYYHGDLCDLLLRGDTILKETGTSGDQSKAFLSSAIVSLDGDTDYWFDLPPKDALTYAAGYFLLKCSEKHQCAQFDAYLKDATLFNDSRTYTHYKEFNKNSAFYKRLKVPPESFINYVKKLETTFLNRFLNLISKNPANSLLPFLRKVNFQIPCSCFPSEYLLKLFVRFRIFATLRYNDKNIKQGKENKRCYFDVKPL